MKHRRTTTTTDKRNKTMSESQDLERISAVVHSMEETQRILLESTMRLNKLRLRIKSCSELLKNSQKDAIVQKTELEAIQMNGSFLHQQAASLEKLRSDQHHGDQRMQRDGYVIWRIDGVAEKMRDSQTERQTSTYSPPYYTSTCGYKFCIRLYLNGDGTARGTHVSIFLVILRGEFDSLLKWPFSYRVSFCLCDQRTTLEGDGTQTPKHVIESFRPDIQSISFTEPYLGMNIASGIPKLLPLPYFEQPSEINHYVVNDTMFIKLFIDFADLPRSMLPFIFSIDDALPSSIRYRMIDDEEKRLKASTMAT